MRSSRGTVVLVLVASSVCSAFAEPAGDRSAFKKSFLNKNCDYSYSPTCLKIDIVSWIDKLNEDDNYNVLPGVSLVRQNASDGDATDLVAELARKFPDDPDSRLDAYLLKKVASYVKGHALKLNLFDGEEKATGRGGGGGGGGGGFGGGGGGGKGGGKKGGGGGMGMELLAAAAMMKGTLFAVALKGIALIAGKALMVGTLALLLAGAIGLKSLLSHGGSGHTTYEVVAHPVHSQVHSHSVSHEGHYAGGGGGGGGGGGHSGWGRSFDDLPAGLQPGYKPPQ